jgi:hypothetical protein
MRQFDLVNSCEALVDPEHRALAAELVSAVLSRQ